MSPPLRPGLSGNRPRQSPGGFFRPLFKTVVFVIFCGGIYYFWFLSKPAATLTPNGPGAPGGATTVELATTASLQKQQLAVAKFKQRQLLGIYEEVKRAFDEWEKEQLAWEQEGPPLLTNENGRRIATDAAQVKRFRGVSQPERPTNSELAAARRDAEELVSPIREALSNAEDASTPSEEITTNLRTFQTQARKAREGYRQARDAVRAMLVQAQGNAPGEKTLRAVIDALDQEEATARATVMDAAVTKEKDEGAKKRADEMARLQKEKDAAEAARIAGEAERTRQEAAMAAEKRKQEEEFAAAKNLEEMAAKLKEDEQRLARERDLAEQKRQGELKTGSVWKGDYTVNGKLFQGELTIKSRDKDDITGSIVFRRAGEKGSLSFEGTVKGTSLTLNPTDGAPASQVYKCNYQPTSKTITGSSSYHSFSLKLQETKD